MFSNLLSAGATASRSPLASGRYGLFLPEPDDLHNKFIDRLLVWLLDIFRGETVVECFLK